MALSAHHLNSRNTDRVMLRRALRLPYAPGPRTTAWSVPYAALAQVQRAAELGECRALASGHGLTVTADADPLLEAPTSEDAAAARLIAPSGTFL